MRSCCVLENGREAATPGDTDFFKNEVAGQAPIKLEGAEATKYRAAVARLNYMTSERPSCWRNKNAEQK